MPETEICPADQVAARSVLPWKYLSAAALEGCLFWLAYGAIELATGTLIPLLTDSLSAITPAAWQWIGVLLFGYAVVGTATGALARLALHWLEIACRKRSPGLERRVERYADGLALALVYTSGLLLRSPGRRVVLVAVALILALGVACISRRSVRSVRWILCPWPVAFLLLAPSAATFELFSRSPRLIRVAGWLAAVSVIAVAAFALSRIRRPLADHTRPSWKFRLAIPLAAIFIFAGCAMFVSSRRALDRSKTTAALSGVATGRPNVLLLTLDTVRADHTSLAGYIRDTTPNLRRFSQDAVVYSNVSAVADQTLSTHASIFTGLYPRHGEHLGDHRLLFHAKSVYQSLIHVPLIIKYPASRKPAVVGAPVSQIDVMPTILTAIGITTPPSLPGLNLQTITKASPRILARSSTSNRQASNVGIP